MIKAPKNWDSVQAASERPKLLPGGYVIEIKKAEPVKAASGYEYLDLTIDICEGDFKDFYAEDYKMQQDRKNWRGHVRQGIPKEDAPEDDWTARAFKGLIAAIEHSNDGYTWDWDESKLKGKIAGCLFRSEEYDFNGFQGWSTRPWKLVSADRIREGKYQVPNPKGLTGNDNAPKNNDGTPVGFEQVSDDDIPF